MKTNPLTRALRAAAACSVALLCLHALSAKATTLTNWARAGTATQSSTYSAQAVASVGIDGNTAGGWGDASTTHTATANAGEWWQVDLKAIKPIGHIHLWFREDCCASRDENLRIVIFDSTNVTTRVVMWETNNTAWAGAGMIRDMGFDVDPTVNGQVVYVEHMAGLPDYVSLAECEVFNQKLLAPTNHALVANGASATSSSVYTANPDVFGPQQAIDGNHMGLSGWGAAPYFWGYSAPDNSGADPLPWWRVDLPTPSTIGSVVLWPRRDRSNIRFQNTILTVADAGNNVLYQQVFTTVPSGPKFVVNLVPPVANAQIVTIETTTNTPEIFLNLPEVELFAPLASAPTITFTTNLQNIAIQQNLPLTIGPVTAIVDGGIRPEDISYRWYRNGVAIPNMAGSWLNSYTAPSLAVVTNTGDKYKVEASVSGHGVFSTEITLTVTNDITPPTIVGTNFTVTATVALNLIFSELLDPQSATNSANYVLAGGPTLGAITLAADGKTVTVVVQNLLLGDLVDLTVSGVKDLAGNAMVAKHIVAASPQAPINYALSGIAYEDSVYGGTCVASRGIDGNTAGTWGANTIACTGGSIPGWWEVDLLQPRSIGSVVIYWRTDCCPRNADLDMVFYDSANTNATRTELLRIPISGDAGLGSAPFTQDFGAAPVNARVVHLEHRPETSTASDGGAWQLCVAEVMVLPPPTGLQVTSSPRSWTVNEGDRVLLKTTVTGSLPITYKWQRNGVDVPVATAMNLTFPAIAAAQAGTYTLVTSNSLRVRTSDPAVVVVNPRPSLANSLVARYTFDADTGTNNIVDTAPMNPAKTVMHDAVNNNTTWQPAIDGRNGVLQFDGTTAPYSEIEAIDHPDFDGPNTNAPLTLTMWIKTGPCDANPGNSGATLFDRLSGAQGYGAFSIQALDATGGGTNFVQHDLTGGYNVGTNAVGDDIWHHVTLIYGHVPYSIGIVYVDGKLDSDGVWDLPGSWPTFRNLMIGRSWDGWWKRFNGYMDDVYMFNRMLNATEVAQVMTGNLPPLVSVTNPVNNATILQGAAIVLGASASDIEGTVTNVAFYADGALLGSDTTAPYSYTWTTAALGAHTLAAVAWDNTGLSSTSAVVNITVTVPPPYRSYTSAPITENFDGLGPNGTSLSLLVGWNAGHFSPSIQQGTSGGNGVATVTDPLVVDNGSHDTGGTPMLANFGTTGSADRALGSFARTTPAGDQFLQLAIKNDSGNPIGSFTLSYKGEEWRSANAAAQDLTMWYSNTDATNGFVSMGSGFTFNSPNNSGSNVALDGNASGNYTLISGTYTPASPIAAGSIFYLRWYDINNNGIADDFFAIDDVVVTPAAPVPPKPVISGITGPVAGQFTIQGTTAAAATLVTEMATNLAAPIFWVKIQTNAVPGGAYSITFPQGTGPSAYYRVLSQ